MSKGETQHLFPSYYMAPTAVFEMLHVDALFMYFLTGSVKLR